MENSVRAEYEKLVNSTVVDDRIKAAMDPNCPPDLMKVLANDKDNSVLTYLAANPKCDPEVLKDLYILETKYLVLENPNCPSELMELTIKRNDISGLEALVSNINCPVEYLKNMPFLTDSIKLRILSNPSCPKELIDEIITRNPNIGNIISEVNCSSNILDSILDNASNQFGLACKVAANPNCSEDALRRLYKSYPDNIKVMESLAKNPNCPPDVLAKIITKGQYLIISLIMCNPKYSEVMIPYIYMDAVRKALLQNPNCPSYYFDFFIPFKNQFEIILAVKNPNCPEHILEYIIDHENGYGQEVVYTKEKDRELVGYDTTKQNYIGYFADIARNPNCTQRIIDKMAEKEAAPRKIEIIEDDNYPRSYTLLAKNPYCPPEYLDKLADIDSREILTLIAKNPNTSLNTLEKLILNSRYDLSDFVVKNKNFSSDLLIKIFEKGYKITLIKLAKNPNCLPEHLDKLADIDYIGILSLVAKNPKASLKTLEKLLNNTKYDLRGNIVANKNCHPDLLLRIYENATEEIKAQIVKNPNCPIKILKELLDSDNSTIKIAIANNSKCPSKYLEVLSKDKNGQIRAAVLDNPNCTTDLKYQMMGDEDQTISRKARANFNYFYQYLFDACGLKKYKNKTKGLYYLFFSIYCSGVRTSYSSDLTNEVNAMILNGEVDNDILSYISSIPNCFYYFNNESNGKLSVLRENTRYSNNISDKIDLITNIIELLDSKKKSNKSYDYGEYIDKPNSIKNEVECTDFYNISKGMRDKSTSSISLKVNKPELFSENNLNGAIEFGEYPQDKVSVYENTILELLFENHMLSETGRTFRLNKLFRIDYSFTEYKINGRKFIRVGEKNFIEVKPIEWTYDEEKQCLISKKALLFDTDSPKSLTYFYKEVVLDRNLDLSNELEMKLALEKEGKAIKEDKYIESIKDEIVDMQEESDIDIAIYERMMSLEPNKRVSVPLKFLLNEFSDYYEFKEEFVEYLNVFDIGDSLLFFSSNNADISKLKHSAYYVLKKAKPIKLSGLDLSKVRIVVDPQIAYEKDLSNCILSSYNVSLGTNFNGCNLCGADVSKTGLPASAFAGAIKDDKTILPNDLSLK